MKRMFTLLLTMILCIGLISCGSDAVDHQLVIGETASTVVTLSVPI